MTVIVVRHEFSEADKREKYGFDLSVEVIAASMMRRTQETAFAAGFCDYVYIYN